MPKVRPLYHHNLGYGSFDRYVLERPGVTYKNHYVILKNPGRGPHMYFCGHCGEVHPAIRIAVSEVLEETIKVAIDEEDAFPSYITAEVPSKDLYRGNQNLSFAEFPAEALAIYAKETKFEEEEDVEAEVIEPEPNDFLRNDWAIMRVQQKKSTAFDERCKNEVVAFKCGGCGEYAPSPEVQVIDQRKKENMFHSLVWAEVKDIAPNRIRFVWITRDTTAWQDKLQYKVVSNVLSINTLTGQAYLLAPYQDKKRAKWYKGPNLRTVTYTADGHLDMYPEISHMPVALWMQLADMIHQKISAQMPYPVKSLSDYISDHIKDVARLKEIKSQKQTSRLAIIPTPDFSESLPRRMFTMYFLMVYNRFPNLNPYTFSKVVDEMKSQYRKKSKNPEELAVVMSKMDKRISKIKNDNPDPVGALLTSFNIPITKTYRKSLQDQITNLFRIQAIRLNFKEIANVKKLLDSYVYRSEANLRWLTEDQHVYGAGFFLSISEFIKLLIAEQGETIIANKIAALRSMDVLKDTTRSYKQIRAKAPQMELSFKGTLVEIHDRFSEIYDTMAHPNIPIEYVDLEKSIEMETEDYMIYLAKDTKELRTVGRTMGICVGGYGDRAVSKKLYIVLVVNKKSPERYEVCIEMDARRKLIYQAKIRRNHLLDEKPEMRQLVLGWIKHNELLVDTYDLPEENREDADAVAKFQRSDYKPQWIIDKQKQIEAEVEERTEEMEFRRAAHLDEELEVAF